MAAAPIPVIMLTAKSLSADKVLSLTAGADDYIIKPFDDGVGRPGEGRPAAGSPV